MPTLVALVVGAAAIAFSAPASAAEPPRCTAMTEMVRSGRTIVVPTAMGSPSCQIGRDYAANATVVSRLQSSTPTAASGRAPRPR
ncbi:hypothetical protein [Saccharothrix luteola]|uniref:hypothetical protein n=1 Tax=Saccharothrix luteola TaxID=2893018 RepID=UPI001E5277C2|nr:hypothetical protein [Saccharothrix luteola]MCC8250965.1 hypothetical protein [Saccharothrix luteola]